MFNYDRKLEPTIKVSNKENKAKETIATRINIEENISAPMNNNKSTHRTVFEDTQFMSHREDNNQDFSIGHSSNERIAIDYGLHVEHTLENKGKTLEANILVEIDSSRSKRIISTIEEDAYRDSILIQQDITVRSHETFAKLKLNTRSEIIQMEDLAEI